MKNKRLCKCGKTNPEVAIEKVLTGCKVHPLNECCDCGYIFSKEKGK